MTANLERSEDKVGIGLGAFFMQQKSSQEQHIMSMNYMHNFSFIIGTRKKITTTPKSHVIPFLHDLGSCTVSI